MPYVDIAPEDLRRIGEGIYQSRIRQDVEPSENRKVVVIDVKSGDYEVDADHLAAARRLLQRHPGARIWTRRVGYRAVYKMGFR